MEETRVNLDEAVNWLKRATGQEITASLSSGRRRGGGVGLEGMWINSVHTDETRGQVETIFVTLFDAARDAEADIVIDEATLGSDPVLSSEALLVDLDGSLLQIRLV